MKQYPMKSGPLVVVIVGVLLYLAAAKPAYAYLDPGTGSYVFQLLIAGLLGGAFFLRSTYKTIIRKFKKDPEPEKNDEED